MRDLGVPPHFDINPFAANADGTRVATSTGDLNAGQRERLEESVRQMTDVEAYVGDANEFVRRDYHERGAAREVRPDGTLGPRRSPSSSCTSSGDGRRRRSPRATPSARTSSSPSPTST